MKNIQKIKPLFFNTCAVFSATVFIICALGTFLDPKQSLDMGSFFASLFGMLAFSFVLACLGEILKIKKWHIALRIFLHFAGSMLCFYILFVQTYTPRTSSGGLVIMLLAAGIYVIVAAAILLVRYFYSRSRNNNEKYETQFKLDK